MQGDPPMGLLDLRQGPRAAIADHSDPVDLHQQDGTVKR